MSLIQAYAENKSTITIAAAANLASVVKDLKVAYNIENPGNEILIVTASSGKLAAQILNGAPFDIFMSADMEYPKKVFESGLALYPPKVYAYGKLLLLTAVHSPLSGGLSFLTQANIKKIALANPRVAPYGKAAAIALSNAGLFDSIKHKLIYAENIQQAAEYVAVSADVGFIAESMIYDNNRKEIIRSKINWVKIDTNLYKPIEQGILILNNSIRNPEVRKFYKFIFSEQAQKIFRRYGYQQP
jgi:molybdate transport system substrate-binding protein